MSNREAIGLTKDDSLVIKGVAILAMMWHHSFLEGHFEDYDLSFFPLGMGRVSHIAVFFKICVSMFAFVSGYGLYYSLRGLERKKGSISSSDTLTWYKIRYIKSFSEYWLIVILAWIIEQIVIGRTQTVFFKDNSSLGVIYMLLELTGLGHLFGTPYTIVTWWYMSAALVYILFAPALYMLIRRYSGLFCFAAVSVLVRSFIGYPGSRNWLPFLPAFIIGMSCADTNWIGRVRSFAYSSRTREYFLIAGLILASYLCYRLGQVLPLESFWDVRWGLFVPIYIALIVLTVTRMPFVRDLLRFLGSWSADIFLIHTFFRIRYATDLVYAPGNFLLVITRLLALGLLATALLKVFKKLIRYDSYVDTLLARCAE